MSTYQSDSQKAYFLHHPCRRKGPAPNYVELDEGRWILRYLDEDGKPQTEVLELEWHEQNAEDARRVACRWLDVGSGDIDIRQ